MEFNGPEWIFFLLNGLTLFDIGVGLTLKLKKGGCVWVIEVRRVVGGSSLDSGGAGGVPEKECFSLDFYFSGHQQGFRSAFWK